MFINIYRPFYNFTKDHLSGENGYYIKLLYILDLLIFFNSSAHFLFISYLMYTKFDTSYDFRNIDVIARFYWDFASQMDSFFPVLVVIFALFHLVCETELMRNNHQSLTSRWFYQVIVQNQDHYYNCMLNPNEIAFIQQQKEMYFHNNIKNQIFVKFGVFKKAVKLYCKLKAKIIIWNNFEHINKRQFFKRNLAILPNLSQNIKMKIIKTLIVSDLVGFLLQVFYGMRFIFFNFNLFFITFSCIMCFFCYNFVKKTFDWYCLVGYFMVFS